MRDLVPPEAGRRRALARVLGDTFASFGYAPVATPPFELESVIARAIEGGDRRELLRFVDAESGEVVVLRPDITPQIARLVASRLRDRPPPIRLSYEGHVVRRRRGRARTQRQIAQAGVECLGVASEHADLEIIELTSRALKAAGLGGHRIELNLTPLAGALLDRVDAAFRDEARLALARKDPAELVRLLATSSRDVQRGMLSCLELLGGAEVLDRARRVFDDRASRARIDALGAIHRALEELELGVAIGLDLGEPRGFGYYTGTSFAVLAEGPGEPVAVGGRYDDLLARFGAAMPATGVAIDLDHLEWALGEHAPSESKASTVVLAGEASAAVCAAIRSAGVGAVALPGATLAEARRYAASWDHPVVAVVKRGRAQVFSGDGEGTTVALSALPSFVARARNESSRTKR
jgi:ATP phosphoribosyltransferase regulatory subunit